MTTALSLVTVIPWLWFILSYTGRGNWLTVRRLGAVSIPLVLGGAMYVVPQTLGFVISGYSQEQIAAGTVVSASVGPLGGLLGVYVYLVFATGLGIVVKTVLGGLRLFAGQALTFVFGSLVTITASILVIVGTPIDGYPLTQVALGGQAILWGYAVFGQQLLQHVPAVAEIGEKAVFQDLDDGVVVFDDGGTVVRSNPRARAMLDGGNPAGEPVAPLFDLLDVDAVAELPTRTVLEGRTYLVDSSRIRNWQNEPVGHALMIRDITSLVTREQRLDVLNRVIRTTSERR